MNVPFETPDNPIERGAVGDLLDEPGEHLAEVAGERPLLPRLRQGSAVGAYDDPRSVG